MTLLGGIGVSPTSRGLLSQAENPKPHRAVLPRAIATAVGGILAIYAAAYTAGSLRWRSSTETLRNRLESADHTDTPARVGPGDLEPLPEPVRRYFRAVLGDGGPVVARVSLRHTGTFNMSGTKDDWRPFTSEQWVVPAGPGFLWNGRIDVAPGLPVRVHDAYVEGEGILRAAVLGLVPVADQEPGPMLAEGELLRYLAEAVWYPTALLPGQGIVWEAADDRSAFAILTDGETSVRMLFTFGEDGLVETVAAAARGRAVGEDIVPTPWQGRFWDYEWRDGMRVPQAGEVAWLTEDGEKPYWRGRITSLEYEFVP